ncbi:gas vesicle protein [Streptomyces physcomitrii]|uniref:gas vesicle protein n=1 Tax=Streptomyces physcomitrii TaxID=2724184 RepID=UPI003F4CE08B
MSDSFAGRLPSPSRATPATSQQGSSANLADILERVLDKGVVIAGDIQINLLDIELLTIKLRLLIASVDKAKEMGIDWWEHDPSLSSRASRQRPGSVRSANGAEALSSREESGSASLREENDRLRAELDRLRAESGAQPATATADEEGTR